MLTEISELKRIAHEKNLFMTIDALTLASLVKNSQVISVVLELLRSGNYNDEVLSLILLSEALPFAVENQVLTEREAFNRLQRKRVVQTEKNNQLGLFDDSNIGTDGPGITVNISKARLPAIRFLGLS